MKCFKNFALLTTLFQLQRLQSVEWPNR